MGADYRRCCVHCRLVGFGSDVEVNRDGSIKVELLIPFQHLGFKYDSITVRPFLFDHVIRWQSGEFRSVLHLMAAITGEQESTLRMLRYPDPDRIFAAMWAIAPQEIRGDLAAGKMPLRIGEQPAEAEAQAVEPGQEQEPESEPPADDGLLEEDAA